MVRSFASRHGQSMFRFPLMLCQTLILACLWLPTVSGKIVTGEWCTLSFRCFNIAEVSPWGWCAIIPPVLLWLLLLLPMRLPRKPVCLALAASAALGCVGVFAGLPAAEAFLLEADAVSLEYGIGLAAFPAACLAAFMVSLLFAFFPEDLAKYCTAMRLCRDLEQEAACLNEEGDKMYLLYLDMLFWANEYASQRALMGTTAIDYANRDSFEKSGASARHRATLANCSETFLPKFNAVVREKMEIEDIDHILPDDAARLDFACFLSLYWSRKELK